MECLKGIKEFSPEWFDASSSSWRANKKRKGESWVYICSRNLCKRVVHGVSDMCSRHTSAIKTQKVEIPKPIRPTQSVAHRVAQRRRTILYKSEVY